MATDKTWWGWARQNDIEPPRRFCLVANSECHSHMACMDFLVVMFTRNRQWATHTLVALPVGETPTKGKL